MQYSDFTLDQMFERCKNYQDVCNIFFGLAKDLKRKEQLESILYTGGYKDFGCSSKISNKNNPGIELQRRFSMAYLLIRNPETFDFFVENQINLFHGTNANALPNILKYGLNSVSESQKIGLEVSTGETWSRIGGKRDFVSLTDVLGIAEGYSTLKPEKGSNKLSFEVIIGTNAEEVFKAGKCTISSDIPEVGVKNRLPLEGIRVICVPSDKVEFVKKIVNSENIKVLAVDDIEQKFYYFDGYGGAVISQELLAKLKKDLQEPVSKKEFRLKELESLMQRRLLSNVAVQLEKFRTMLIGGKKKDYEGRNI